MQINSGGNEVVKNGTTVPWRRIYRRNGQTVHDLLTYETEMENLDEELTNQNGTCYSQTLHYGQWAKPKGMVFII